MADFPQTQLVTPHDQPQPPRLTVAQFTALSVIEQKWDTLAEPTVIRLASPIGRGKTQIIHEFFARLVKKARLLGNFYDGDAPWRNETNWRRARKVIQAAPPDFTQQPTWLWLGLNTSPGVPTDVLQPVKQLAVDLHGALERDKISEQARALLQQNSGALGILRRAAYELAVDAIPFGGPTKTALETTVALAKAWRSRDSVNDNLESMAAGPDAGILFLQLVCLLRQLRAAEAPPALLPAIFVVENAEHLDPRAFRDLTSILTLNPARDATRNVISGPAFRTLKAHGIPPAVPVLLVMLETTDSRSDPFVGPGRELHERSNDARKAEESWLTRWSEMGVRVHDFGDPGLPLMTKTEARRVASTKLGLAAKSPTVSLLVDHAVDQFLGGVNAALLISHTEKVATLTSPETEVDPVWASENLPRYLHAEIEQRYDDLTVESKRTVKAAGLVGHAFSLPTLATLLDKPLTSKDLEAPTRLGFVHNLPDDEWSFSFDDSMHQSFAESQAHEDVTLCNRALDLVTVPKARMLADRSGTGPDNAATYYYEWTKQALHEYRALVERLQKRGYAPPHRDVWLASLVHSADIDMVYAGVGDEGSRPARHRLDELATGKDAGASGEESPYLWLIVKRWHIHRRTPGPFTPSSLLSLVRQGSTTANVTRTMPEAHAAAIQIARSGLVPALRRRLKLNQHGIRLLSRLGRFGVAFDRECLDLVVRFLVEASAVSATAAHLAAFEYAHELTDTERGYLTANLALWAHLGDPRIEARSLVALRRLDSWELLGQPRAIADRLLQIIVGGSNNDWPTDFDSNGRIVDFSDPLVYPWMGLRVLACQVLSEPSTVKFLDAERRSKLRDYLMAELYTHPSAAAVLIRNYVDDLTDDQRNSVDSVALDWVKTGLPGIMEQAGLYALNA